MSLALMASHHSDMFQCLLNHVFASDDPFQAAALHPWVNKRTQVRCEDIILARRRYPRLFAASTFTPASLLSRLAKERDPVIQNKLLKNPFTPIHALKSFAKDCKDINILTGVAMHTQSDMELLELLGRESHPGLRHALCRNLNTGLAQLFQLLSDANSEDRKAIARNSHCSVELLSKLWDQSQPYLCAEIASHDNCPSDLLSRAISSEDPLLRRKAASNVHLSMSQRVLLLTDKEASVRAAALFHCVKNCASLVQDQASRVRRLQAGQISISPELLRKLSSDEDNWVRRRVARNPVTPQSILTTLASDSEIQVRRAVARNPAASKSLRSHLAADPAAWVRAGIAFRDDIDIATIRQLSLDDSIDVLSGLARHSNTSVDLLFRFANHHDRDLRRAVILNPKAPFAVLQLLQQDPYPINRVQLCRHPILPDEFLWRFLDDPEPQVRFTTIQVMAERCIASL